MVVSGQHPTVHVVTTYVCGSLTLEIWGGEPHVCTGRLAAVFSSILDM